MMESYIKYLDELTDRERSVFLYCFVLGLSVKDTAKRLKKDSHKVSKICNDIKRDIDFKPLKDSILEAFNLTPGDML